MYVLKLYCVVCTEITRGLMWPPTSMHVFCIYIVVPETWLASFYCVTTIPILHNASAVGPWNRKTKKWWVQCWGLDVLGKKLLPSNEVRCLLHNLNRAASYNLVINGQNLAVHDKAERHPCQINHSISCTRFWTENQLIWCQLWFFNNIW